jgi:hypothetical protein
VTRSSGVEGADGEVPLFVVTPDGRLSIAADGQPPTARPVDTVIALVEGGDGRRPAV